MAPPPTMPSTSSVTSFPSSSSMPALPPASSANADSYDPLAALMAPRAMSYSAMQMMPPQPASTGPSSSSLGEAGDSGGESYDPLAALMAPRVHSFSAFQPSSSASTFASATASSVPFKPPNVSMWTPPPAPAASQNTPLSSIAEDASSHDEIPVPVLNGVSATDIGTPSLPFELSANTLRDGKRDLELVTDSGAPVEQRRDSSGSTMFYENTSNSSASSFTNTHNFIEDF